MKIFNGEFIVKLINFPLILHTLTILKAYILNNKIVSIKNPIRIIPNVI